MRCQPASWRLAIACSVGLVAAPRATAQIVTDGSMGPATNLQGPNAAVTPALGRQVGKNLFHSFSTFQVRPGESATFSGPTGVRNVLARVTGGQTSTIAGRLACSIPSANLYLINPAGVVIASGASFDVSGSIVISTADVVKLKDGGRFDATNPGDTVLTSANPAAFGFLTSSPRQIVVSGDPINGTSTLIQGAPRKSIALVGGDLRLSRAEFQAPSGRVHLISVGSSGDVIGDPASPRQSQDVSGFARLGNVTMTNETVVVSAPASPNDPPGRISVKAHDMRIDTESIVATSSEEQDAHGPGIDVQARGTLAVFDTSGIAGIATGRGRGGDVAVAAGDIVASSTGADDDFSGIGAITFDTGAGGSVRVRADSIDVGASSIIGTIANGAGDAGDLDVAAKTIRVHGTDALIASRPINADALGRAGRVTVRAHTMQVTGGGAIVSRAVRVGLSGDLTITADRLLLDGEASAISAEGTPGPGRSGMTINAASLTISGGASIDATADSGAVGQIAINVTDFLLRGGTIAATSLQGGGGTITIVAKNITFEAGSGTLGLVSTTNLGPGQAGTIRIVTDRLTLRDGAGIVSGTGKFGQSQFDPTGGPGSNIDIRARELIMTGGSVIAAQTTASAGHAGSIQIQGSRISLSDTASIVAPSLATASDPRGGDGGDVVIRADQLQFNGGGDVVVSTASSGNAGNVRIEARRIDLTGRGLDLPLGILSTSSINNGRRDPLQIITDPYGSGGTVDIRATTVNLRNGARITSESLTTARAGNVLVTADDVSLQSGSSIATSGGDLADGGNIALNVTRSLNLDSSSITARAANNILFVKNGGNVIIRAGKQVYLRNSTLTAEAGNNGGNIDIDPDFVILNNSSIVANAVLGDGGDINIAPDQVFLKSAGSTIESRSVRGQPGAITITQVETDVSGALLPFASTLVDAAKQLKETCQRRLTESFSSFVVQGRGGVLPDPTGPGQIPAGDNSP